MIQKIRQVIFANFGAKALALALSVFVWAIISSKEKSYSERIIRVPVELTNVSKNMEIIQVKPEEVQLTVKGVSRTFQSFEPESVRIRIDMKEIERSGRLYFYAEDYLEIPSNLEIISLHPKMIEVQMEQLSSIELPVRVRFRNRIRSDLLLKEYKVIPDKVMVLGYKNQVERLKQVTTEEIDLSQQEQSTTITTNLRKPAEVLKFVSGDQVEVNLVIESKSEPSK